MKSFAKIIFIVFISVFLCVSIFSCSKSPIDLYNGEFLEKKLSMPYNIEGILTQNGEKYDVMIECGARTKTGDKIESGDFRIKFMSGDVTLMLVRRVPLRKSLELEVYISSNLKNKSVSYSGLNTPGEYS